MARAGPCSKTSSGPWLLHVPAAGVLKPVQAGLTASLDKALGRLFLVAAVSLALNILRAVAGAPATSQLDPRFTPSDG